MKNTKILFLILMLAFAGFGFRGCTKKEQKAVDNFVKNSPVAIPSPITVNKYRTPQGVYLGTSAAAFNRRRCENRPRIARHKMSAV